MPIRPHIRELSGYIPGEQPRNGGFIKLNTNENPYPPAPGVFVALRQSLNAERLRKYPDPTGWRFRETASGILGIDAESILIGNGSDDILTIITRACVSEGGLIAAPAPSYLLYRTLAQLQGARFQETSYRADWTLPNPWTYPDADLTFIATPNSPSGTSSANAELRGLASAIRGMLVIDEAYVDFADQNALELAQLPNVIVTRSLSKSYALAGIRFGYAVARPDTIAELTKVKDSYNCDALSLAAAAAGLSDQAYMRETRMRILATRLRLTDELRRLGFTVTPSQANFVWCRRQDRPLRPIYAALKERGILIRYMNFPEYGDGLRITVGTDDEISQLLGNLAEIL